jgi:plasmid stabilization system protein ParE
MTTAEQGLEPSSVRLLIIWWGRIAENPLAFPRAHGEIRRATLHRFPYAIYFRLAGDEVVVLAVHGRQDPRRWQRRT